MGHGSQALQVSHFVIHNITFRYGYMPLAVAVPSVLAAGRAVSAGRGRQCWPLAVAVSMAAFASAGRGYGQS